MGTCDLVLCLPIWQRPESRFNITNLTDALDLKHMLSNLEKPESQPMDEQCQIKSVADSLASIQSPVSDLDLIQHTLNVFGLDDNNFINNLSFLPGGITFDEVRTHLLFHDHCVNFVYNRQHGPINVWFPTRKSFDLYHT